MIKNKHYFIRLLRKLHSRGELLRQYGARMRVHSGSALRVSSHFSLCSGFSKKSIALVLSLISPVLFALPTDNPNMITHGELMRVTGGLLLVLVIIFVLSWLVKRVQGMNLNSSRGFQSIASIHVGPKERLVLMKVGPRYLLMGVGTATITLLHDFGEHLPAGFDGENKPAFSEFLKTAVGKS